jgi:ADP-ribose pyrophosphatase
MADDTAFGPDAVEVERKEPAFQGHFRVDLWRLQHRLFAGGWGKTITREVLERGSAVAVLPYDPVRDEVVLIEQFRIGALAHQDPEPWLLEIVAGVIEPGETPEEVARRETVEECGATLLALEPMHHYYPSPGGCSEFLWMYCGRIDAKGIGGIHGLADEGEDIRVEVLGFDAAMAALDQGRVRSSPGVVGLQWLALNRPRLRQQWR